MAKKKVTKKVTYSEFLSWLEGVESMQEEGWTPNPQQWQTIREKLDTVKPDVQVKEVEVQPTTPDVPVPQGPIGQFVQPPSAFEPPRQPPPRLQLSAHNRSVNPPAAEGVPAANNGPFVDANGNLPPESEFL